jgi:hypothetical protein
MSANNNINVPLKELEKTLPSQAKKSQKLPARVTIRFPWQAKLALSILFFIFVFIGAS